MLTVGLAGVSYGERGCEEQLNNALDVARAEQ